MNRYFLYFLSASHMSVDITSGALPAILPFFVSEYGMDYTSIAGLMFASSFLSSFVQPLFGWLADKGSRQWFMGLGILLSCGSLAVTGFVTDYWTIFIAVSIMGLGSSLFHPEGARTVNALSGHHKGQGLSIFSVGGNAGFGFGPLLAVFLISTFGMKGIAAFGLWGIGMCLASFLLAGKLKQAIAAAAPHNEIASLQKTEDTPAKYAGSQPKAVNDWNSFGRLSIVIFVRSVVFTGLCSFLPLFCIQELGTSAAAGSLTISVFSMAGILATLIGGFMADKKGYVPVLRIGCIMMAPVFAIAILCHNIYVLYAMLIPLSIAVQGPYSSFVVLGQTYLAKNMGFASGVTLGLSTSIGGIVAPSLGKFADTYSINAVMYILIAITVLGAVTSLFLRDPQKNKYNTSK